ncbi:putative ABC transporter permease protein [Gordonia polyisoprenivorans NBRC 16320 = JCM 10675]|uniref:Amino acid ABC transporter permease n=1 Tax=Gordonia polyisoprenivorans TaxID=84595 RepID=A0A846WNP0_9ACTN|nr:ABC transporter permease subunit [Gordonia polyisoprenivorans]NKY02616.1 amino acid ABC transporter permease [Gordonia polyisoprenivorans]GAB24597.1 putative ABC transporter permease protein [Gordonia polyisoprenivorans NBRC 16320 = JCM 10675]
MSAPSPSTSADPHPAPSGDSHPSSAGTTTPPVAERVAPLRHPGRWVLAAIVLIVGAQLVHGLATNAFFQWDRFGYWFFRPVILEGLGVTLEVAAYSAVLALAVGIVLALMRLSNNPVLAAVSWGYVWFFRSIPLIVLLLILFNFGALYQSLSIGVPFGPGLFHFSEADLATPFLIAVIGITVHEAAFAAEIVRGGILSVDAGQHEAAAALGIPRRYHFLRITLPQALRSIVPSYVNLLIGLIKSTSLVYYVSLLDLFGVVSTQSSTYSGDIIPLLMVATVWYVILTSAVSIVQFYIERYFARGAVRTLPPTPIQRLRFAVAGVRRSIALRPWERAA